MPARTRKLSPAAGLTVALTVIVMPLAALIALQAYQALARPLVASRVSGASVRALSMAARAEAILLWKLFSGAYCVAVSPTSNDGGEGALMPGGA